MVIYSRAATGYRALWMCPRGPDAPLEVPPGLVAYELTDEHTLFVMELPSLPPGLPLTRAEHEVVELILQGHSNASIGERRGTSLPTVAKQVSAAFVKLGVRSRAELLSALILGGAAALPAPVSVPPPRPVGARRHRR